MNLSELKAAKKTLRSAPTEQKNSVLLSLGELLAQEATAVLTANERDLAEFQGTAALRDRLALTTERIEAMITGLKVVIASPDPAGHTVESRRLPNGLLLKQVTSPLGAIFMIFESRPNVAIEAFSLAFKSGNAILLRGGSEAKHTLGALYGLIHRALARHNLPLACCSCVTDYDRNLVRDLLSRNDVLDVVVPRGGEGLINFVVETSRIPVIKHDKGLCHTYVHEDADLTMAVGIALNAKTSRPSVCNAMETLLVHQSVAEKFLPTAYAAMSAFGVRWHVCQRSAAILDGQPNVQFAEDGSWNTEYLDFDLNCRIVDSLDEALAHIEAHGSQHSEAIVATSPSAAHRFQAEVDAAAVYWNASTRFTDGGCFGLGAELGISTQKLHARGPVGLRALVSNRWIIEGDGQVR